MKNLNIVFLTLALLLATLFTPTSASTLSKLVARLSSSVSSSVVSSAISSVEPAPTVAFGGPTCEMLTCLEKSECTKAALIYHSCVENPSFDNWYLSPTKNNTDTFECLCDGYHDDWRSSLTLCIPCLATSLSHSPSNMTPSAVDPSYLLDQVLRSLGSYCQNAYARETSLQVLMGAGNGITSRFHSPILLFNVTVAKGPVTDFFWGGGIHGLRVL